MAPKAGVGFAYTPGLVGVPTHLKTTTHTVRMENKLDLLMDSLGTFYETNTEYIEEIKRIVNYESEVSLRVLDWFVTNYVKKYIIIIDSGNGQGFNVYHDYKLQLKSYSKSHFDPFCRKNKITYFYKDDKESIPTSCGQLCFFRWCFEKKILDYVKNNLEEIETDMRASLSQPTKAGTKKRQPLSVSASKSMTKRDVKYTVTW